MTRAGLVPAAAMLLTVSGLANAAPEHRPAAALPARADVADVTLRPAMAGDRRIVGILEVRVDGVSDEVREGFQRRLEEQLDTKHYWLASRARMKEMMLRSTTWTEGCLVGPCITEVAKYTGAELVLLATLTGAGTSFGYVVTLVRTDTGRVLQQHSERCDVCTVSEALDKAIQATIVLLNDVPQRLPTDGPERLVIDPSVARARQDLATQRRRTRHLGIALTAVGLAAVVGSAAMYGLDPDSSYTAAVGAGGAALTLGGLAVLTF